MRRVLPRRRASETFDLHFWNQQFVVTVGFYPEGAPGEVFVDARKTGGDVDAIARDAAVTLSLALQHGCSVESIQRAITRNSNGTPASVLGAVVDCISADTFSGGER